MKKIIAGAMLVFVVLLGTLAFSNVVYAESTDSATSYEVTEESETTTEDETEVSEDAEVLGEKRNQSDKFIIGIEIAISLTFAVGLIAASHGAEIK